MSRYSAVAACLIVLTGVALAMQADPSDSTRVTEIDSAAARRSIASATPAPEVVNVIVVPVEISTPQPWPGMDRVLFEAGHATGHWQNSPQYRNYMGDESFRQRLIRELDRRFPIEGGGRFDEIDREPPRDWRQSLRMSL